VSRYIIWAKSAQTDIINIRAYVDQSNPAAVARMAELLISAEDRLNVFPELGHLINDDRRELVTAAPYVILYRIDDNLIKILGVRYEANPVE
jgi:plasmid stabilization system protein ParE